MWSKHPSPALPLRGESRFVLNYKLYIMKKIIATAGILFLAIVLIGISSCCTHKKTTAAVEPAKTQAVNYEKEGYTKVTVLHYTIDGCQYVLQLADGKKLEPQNLAEELKVDKKELWVKYEIVRGAASICMAGEIVKITDYKVIK